MSDLYEKIIYEDYEKSKQLRLVISDYRDQQYLHLRIYYLDFEGNWQPTKEGASMPATITGIYALLDGLIEICSKEESTQSIIKYFGDKLNELSARAVS